MLKLGNGTTIPTDLVILCTGYTHNLGTFAEDLCVQYGLPSKSNVSFKWAELDRQAEEKVNSQLPYLEHPPKTVKTNAAGTGPARLYRRLISPSMAAEGDRSIYFPGLIHSVFTPLVAEMQALWGVAYLQGRLDLPDQEVMEEEVAAFNVWTRKRYLEQGRKHAYAIYDYLAVSNPFSFTQRHEIRGFFRGNYSRNLIVVH